MSGMFNDLPFFSKGAGDDGKNGVSPTITIADIEGGHRLTIVDANGTKNVDILDGVAGPQGEPGTQGPAGKDGAAGKDGSNGTDGINGKDGSNGADGRGIQSLAITDDELIVLYTDNTSVNLGKVVGADGAQGIQGIPGPAGEQGIQGEQGPEGPQGPAYTLTDADKTELIAAVKKAVLAELNQQA